MSLGGSVSQLFQQLDILEDFKAIGKEQIGLEVFSSDRKPMFNIESTKRPI